MGAKLKWLFGPCWSKIHCQKEKCVEKVDKFNFLY
jgi:hypothetical protein